MTVFFNEDDDRNYNKVPEINNTTETASPKSTVLEFSQTATCPNHVSLLPYCHSSAIKARELWFLKCELKGLNECGCGGWKSEKQAADELSAMLNNCPHDWDGNSISRSTSDTQGDSDVISSYHIYLPRFPHDVGQALRNVVIATSLS